MRAGAGDARCQGPLRHRARSCRTAREGVGLMQRIVALAGLLLLAGALRAQDAPIGEPQADAPVRDVEFGVTVRQFGLERRVEMLQWQSTPHGYERVWSDAPV